MSAGAIRLTLGDLHVLRIYFAHRENELGIEEALALTHYEVYTGSATVDTNLPPSTVADAPSPYDLGFWPVVGKEGFDA